MPQDETIKDLLLEPEAKIIFIRVSLLRADIMLKLTFNIVES